MTPTETVTVLAYLAAGFPTATLDEHTPDVWAQALQDIPFEVARTAAKQIVQADQWFPTVARLREVVGSIQRGTPAAPALPLPRSQPEDVAAGIAAMREAHRRGRP